MNNLLQKFKSAILSIHTRYKAKIYFKNYGVQTDYDVVLINTPLHGNLGDHLIASGTLEFLKDNDIKVLEVPRNYVDYFLKYKNVEPQVKILVHGGGYFGDIYPIELKSISGIVNHFSKNPLIFLPQSIYFKDYDSIHLQELLHNIDNHFNVSFIARENNSYNQACKLNIFNEVILAPDMAFYFLLKRETLGINVTDSSGIKNPDDLIVIKRKDFESILSEKELQKLDLLKTETRLNIREFDTYLSYTTILPRNRNNILSNFLQSFSSNNIVITDRLHGIIFSLITNNKCYFYDNLTNKSTNLYNTWLKDVTNNVIPIEGGINIEQLEEAYKFDEKVLISKIRKEFVNLYEYIK